MYRQLGATFGNTEVGSKPTDLGIARRCNSRVFVGRDIFELPNEINTRCRERACGSPAVTPIP
jgi:hypothetical protein